MLLVLELKQNTLGSSSAHGAKKAQRIWDYTAKARCSSFNLQTLCNTQGQFLQVLVQSWRLYRTEMEDTQVG